MFIHSTASLSRIHLTGTFGCEEKQSWMENTSKSTSSSTLPHRETLGYALFSILDSDSVLRSRPVNTQFVGDVISRVLDSSSPLRETSRYVFFWKESDFDLSYPDESSPSLTTPCPPPTVFRLNPPPMHVLRIRKPREMRFGKKQFSMFFWPCGHTINQSIKQASKQTIYGYWTLLYEKENNLFLALSKRKQNDFVFPLHFK